MLIYVFVELLKGSSASAALYSQFLKNFAALLLRNFVPLPLQFFAPKKNEIT